MIIVIDAINIREGGGVTHLINILKKAEPVKMGFTKIIVLGCRKTLNQINSQPHIIKIYSKYFDSNLILRNLWIFFRLDRFLKKLNASVLFVPGGSILTSFHPVVTMSRNSLPLELKEAKRYGFSPVFLRLLLLRYIQKKSFIKADGFIFLTEYAKNCLIKQGWYDLKSQTQQVVIIPHGVDYILAKHKYLKEIKKEFSIHNPFKIIYVSIIDLYKHQDRVALAVKQLNMKGLHVEIHFVGPFYKPALKNFNKILQSMPGNLKQMIKYHGQLNREKLLFLYSQMDCVLFASSCENLPNILLEGMSSGLPIVCSNRGPMPEILKHAGEYFNPESVNSICDSIIKLYNSFELRSNLSFESFNLSREYSWENCTKATFSFLANFNK
jgi:glycosyltransferase involved in cell wall biosynthesis